jgi:hypothetical protein
MTAILSMDCRSNQVSATVGYAPHLSLHGLYLAYLAWQQC